VEGSGEFNDAFRTGPARSATSSRGGQVSQVSGCFSGPPSTPEILQERGVWTSTPWSWVSPRHTHPAIYDPTERRRLTADTIAGKPYRATCPVRSKRHLPPGLFRLVPPATNRSFGIHSAGSAGSRNTTAPQSGVTNGTVCDKPLRREDVTLTIENTRRTDRTGRLTDKQNSLPSIPLPPRKTAASRSRPRVLRAHGDRITTGWETQPPAGCRSFRCQCDRGCVPQCNIRNCSAYLRWAGTETAPWAG
jgi:hypothetical protein